MDYSNYFCPTSVSYLVCFSSSRTIVGQPSHLKRNVQGSSHFLVTAYFWNESRCFSQQKKLAHAVCVAMARLRAVMPSEKPKLSSRLPQAKSLTEYWPAHVRGPNITRHVVVHLFVLYLFLLSHQQKCND